MATEETPRWKIRIGARTLYVYASTEESALRKLRRAGFARRAHRLAIPIERDDGPWETSVVESYYQPETRGG